MPVCVPAAAHHEPPITQRQSEIFRNHLKSKLFIPPVFEILNKSSSVHLVGDLSPCVRTAPRVSADPTPQT